VGLFNPIFLSRTFSLWTLWGAKFNWQSLGEERDPLSSMLLRWRPNRHQFGTATTGIALVSESRGGGDLKVMSNPWAIVSCDEVVSIPAFVVHPILLLLDSSAKCKAPPGASPGGAL
jgi:hypothetical protein